MTELDLPDEITGMTDDELSDELDRLTELETIGAKSDDPSAEFTDEQALRLEYCRRELLRRFTSSEGSESETEDEPDA